MTQGDVLKILKKFSSNWMSNREIAQKLGISQGSITANTKALRKGHLVDFREEGKGYVHKYKG